jgi:hypothetical protein
MDSSTTPRCTATTRTGRPCRAWAVKGTDPPRCASHRRSPSGDGGTGNRIGAPPGNTNAQTHGAYTQPPDTSVDLDARIADLNRRIEQLSTYIDHATIGPNDGDIDVDQYARLLSLHGQLTSRLGRLLRDKQQISPEDDSLLQQAINNALDQASEILGVQL